MSETPPPDVGTIRYFDRVEPPLTAGEYTLKMNQKLPTELGLEQSSFSRSVEFNISGPRWRIDPANVHMRAPPKNEQGVLCDMSFPRIIFQRKTTPWERTLKDETVNDEDPWMTLLLIREDEMKNYCSLKLSEGSPTGDGIQIKEFTGGADLPNEDPERYVDALEIETGFFERIAPTLDELPLLVHALQVNPLDKEMCGNDEDGWFSVAMSNRIPAKENCKYFACLISLEFISNLSNTLPSIGLDDLVPAIPPSTQDIGSDSTGDIEIILDEEILFRNEELEKIFNGPRPPLPGDLNRTPDDFGPEGRPPIHLDKDIANIAKNEIKQVKTESFDQNIESAKFTGSGNIKRNLFSSFDILLANPLSGIFGGKNRKLKDEVKSNFTDEQKSSETFSLENTAMKDMGIKLDHPKGYDSPSINHPENKTSSYLDQNNSSAPPIDGVRLKFPLLHHWTFKTGNGGDFEARMRGLRVRTHEDEEDKPGELGSIASKSEGTYAPALLGNDMVPDVAINSFVSMDIAGDDGIRRTGYYRGPCIAVPINHEKKERPYYNSDEATGLDVETGRDEISHAAAFELGRLLGMSDPRFIRAINRWRRLRYVEVKEVEEYSMIKDIFQINDAQMTINDLLTKQILAEKVMIPQLERIPPDLPVDIDGRLGGDFGFDGDPSPIDENMLENNILVQEYLRFFSEGAEIDQYREGRSGLP